MQILEEVMYLKSKQKMFEFTEMILIELQVNKMVEQAVVATMIYPLYEES